MACPAYSPGLDGETVAIPGGDAQLPVDRIPGRRRIQGVGVAAWLEALVVELVASHLEGDVPGLLLAGEGDRHRHTQPILNAIAAQAGVQPIVVVVPGWRGLGSWCGRLA